MAHDLHDEEGSALVETCVLAVLLLVPMTWILLSAFTVQKTAYAAAASAREAARAYVTTPGADSTAAAARSRAAANLVLDDFEADTGRVVRIEGALRPGEFVRVTVRARASLPFLPAFLDRASVPVSSEVVAVVDEYR